jgi:acyl-CoA dehydrogenase
MLAVIDKAHQGAAEMMRPIARKYDLKEHAYPVELDTLAELYAGASESNTLDMAGANGLRSSESNGENRNAANMAATLQALEASWGDAAMLLSIPFQGLGNAAVSAVATDEQLERLGRVWAAMAITEPGFGSDSAAVSTTAKLDGDKYVINGEKIFVTAGSRATHIVVWATLDKSKGRAAIKSFIVPREHPGVTVERLENKLGIKGSDTAVIRFENARIPKDNLLGNPEIEPGKGFSGVMETFDNTRPVVAAMAVGIARATLEELRKILTNAGVEISYDKPAQVQSAAAAEFLRMEAEWESSYQLTLRAAWQADNNIPNSKEASMSKAKAGRVGSDITLKAVELVGTIGYSEETLLEKWARDSKIMDIFEGTQQIQQLVVARRLLGLSSSELK